MIDAMPKSYSSWPLPSLRALRLQRLLTQAELAEQSGVSLATIIRVENGASAQSSTIRKLAAALKVRPSALQAEPD